MRGNPRNDGRSRLPPHLDGEARLRRFPTGNAVFSTPVLDAGDRIYVGSADHRFYCFDPADGSTRWAVITGEIIDSAAALCRDGSVVVPGGDGRLLALDREDGSERWCLDLLKRRERFTPSTIYWWEGNVVEGPNGLLYAGNDDFRLYAVEPGGAIRWSFLTGLHIWAAPAFPDEQSVLVASFDQWLYLLDAETGRELWRLALGNFPAASPAVGEHGLAFIGTFGGYVHAVEVRTGRPRWSARLGAHIYASCALSGDGLVIVGAADGNVVALDEATGQVRWTHDAGDAVRSSAAIGPDPRGEHPWLAYVGSGDGRLIALTPQGRRRWTLDTIALRPEGRAGTRYVNLNASVALGRRGLATANAAGDVLFVPYDLDRHEHPAVSLREDDGLPPQGRLLWPVSAGGVPAADPAAPVPLARGEAFALRVVHREGGRTFPVRIRREELPVRIGPYRVDPSPDGSRLHLVPEAPDPLPADPIELAVPYEAEGGPSEARGVLRLVEAGEQPSGPLPAGFQVVQMALPSPAVVPSFDQIGLASLSIDIGVVRHEGERVVAWGVQRFGLDERGEVVGVPEPRVLYYAFEGSLKDGALVLTARDVRFEITAFPVPLDTLTLSATLGPDGVRGGSLAATLALRDRLAAPWPAGLELRPVLHRVGARLARLGALGEAVRRWFPDQGRLSSAPDLLGTLVHAARLTVDLAVGGTWRPWGLLDDQARFFGLGTFVARPLPQSDPGAVVGPAVYRASEHLLAAAVEDPGSAPSLTLTPGLLLLEPDCRPVALDYTGRTTVIRDDQGRPTEVRLDLPLGLRPPAEATVVSMLGAAPGVVARPFGG